MFTAGRFQILPDEEVCLEPTKPEGAKGVPH
jgi:hypothetical protein